MLKVAVTALLFGTSSVAFAQSESSSASGPPKVTAETHCKDKSGNVWLKSSAILAGTPSAGSAGASSGSAPTSGAGRDLSTIAPTLPDCPDQSATPGAPVNTTTGTGRAGGAGSDTSGGAPSTRTPSGLTPD
jgi:hypothetical protein